MLNLPRMKALGPLSLLLLASGCWCFALDLRVKTDAGEIEGLNENGIAVFKGIPFAAPPVGPLRWKNPQPVQPWDGVRSARNFGPRAMQGFLYPKKFRDAGPSEDCLYLNVWTPAKAPGDKLPVMVWIHGGGWRVGSGSEPDHDGGRLAARGVIVVNFNYRLDVFSSLTHPELTAELGKGVSGFYGNMDQVAALRWVQRNIAAFGGDPGNVTIFGESAGGAAVGLLTATPLAHGLFHKVICESGGAGFLTRKDLAEALSQSEAERRGVRFAASVGAANLAELRAVPAEKLIDAAMKDQSWNGYLDKGDGVFLPVEDMEAWYAAQRQNHVPVLAGWNADEVRVYHTVGKEPFSAKKFIEQTRAKYGTRADAILRLYPAGTDVEAVRSAGDLEGDLFTGYTTWKWLEEQARTGVPVYRYVFDRVAPVAPGRMINDVPVTAAEVGAVHFAEVAYVFGSFDVYPEVPWKKEDRVLSEQMMTLWTNFAKTGNPNSDGLPNWPRYRDGDPRMVFHLDTQLKVAPEAHRERYEFWAADAVEARKERAAAEQASRVNH